jgi:4-hydroxy-2-oxoheptanedioate aldolase
MQENRLKSRGKSGQPAYGAWLAIPSSFSAEVVARQGFDYVCIDLQHGLIDYQIAVTMLQAIGNTSATPIVRVPSNDFGTINKVLDAGALGVIIPMVNSAAEARAAVSACRYAPAGSRSFGPARAALSAGGDYFERANDVIACIPMIETAQAVDALDDILGVPGIDAVYVGPNDLSITLGIPPGPDNEGPYQEAYQRVAQTCTARGVTAGIHANAQLAAKHVSNGYRMITVSTDFVALLGATARDLRTARPST